MTPAYRTFRSSENTRSSDSVKRLAGKIAIVTGSSSGIGKAIALTFAEEGARVVVAARRQDLCEQTVKQIREKGGDAMAIQTDVTDESQVERLITQTVQRYGRLDILVNNAGIESGGQVAENNTKNFDEGRNTKLPGKVFFLPGGVSPR